MLESSSPNAVVSPMVSVPGGGGGVVARGAEQLASVPPFAPEHTHVHGPEPETVPGVPALHSPEVGAVDTATPLAGPQTPLTGGGGGGGGAQFGIGGAGADGPVIVCDKLGGCGEESAVGAPGAGDAVPLPGTGIGAVSAPSVGATHWPAAWTTNTTANARPDNIVGTVFLIPDPDHVLTAYAFDKFPRIPFEFE